MVNTVNCQFEMSRFKRMICRLLFNIKYSYTLPSQYQNDVAKCGIRRHVDQF